MQKNDITLSTKEELNIFMSPQRQQLIRMLSIEGGPMTAKAIGEKLNISASSAQHHLKKLMQIGLIEQDHTEIINGITAMYFRLSEATVHIGLQRDDELNRERNIVSQNLISQVYSSCMKSLEHAKKLNIPELELQRYGDILTGVIHLTPVEAKELMKLISGFLAEHSKPEEGTEAWEYAMITYNTKIGS